MAEPVTAAWPCEIPLAQVDRGAVKLRLQPDAAQRKAIAKQLGLVSLEALSAEVRLLQFSWIERESPIGRAVGGTVVKSDVLLAVDDEVIFGETADVDTVAKRLREATGPITITVVDEAFIYDIPEDAAEVAELVRPNQLGIGERFRQWQMEFADAGVAPKVVPPIKEVVLDTAAAMQMASATMLGAQTCVTCKERDKEVVLGCGHCLCTLCSERAFKCPIVGCGRLIMKKSKMSDKYRSSLHELATRGTTSLGHPTPKQLAEADAKLKQDAGRGALAGGWQVPTFENDEITPERRRGSLSGKKKTKRTPSIASAPISSWQRDLPTSHKEFEAKTDL